MATMNEQKKACWLHKDQELMLEAGPDKVSKLVCPLCALPGTVFVKEHSSISASGPLGIDEQEGHPVDHHRMQLLAGRYCYHKQIMTKYVHQWQERRISENKAKEMYRLAMDDYDKIIKTSSEMDQDSLNESMAKEFDDW